MIAHSATARRTHPATKWRNDVAMGVSPWNENPHHAISPKGTTGNPACAIHVAPSGLRVRFDLSIHGFAPVATTCRPFGTNVLTPSRVPCAEEVEDDGVPATKWRNDVAMGVSPWNENPHHAISPEGTTGNSTQPTHAAPSGLVDCVCSRIHGFAPVATRCRPFGTNVLTPSRVPCAEEVEDDGVPFAEKMEGLTRELATQFHEPLPRTQVAFDPRGTIPSRSRPFVKGSIR